MSDLIYLCDLFSLFLHIHCIVCLKYLIFVTMKVCPNGPLCVALEATLLLKNVENLLEDVVKPNDTGPCLAFAGFYLAKSSLLLK